MCILLLGLLASRRQVMCRSGCCSQTTTLGASYMLVGHLNFDSFLGAGATGRSGGIARRFCLVIICKNSLTHLCLFFGIICLGLKCHYLFVLDSFTNCDIYVVQPETIFFFVLVREQVGLPGQWP